MIECSEFFKNLHKKLTSYNIGRKYNRILHFYGPMIGFDFVGKKYTEHDISISGAAFINKCCDLYLKEIIYMVYIADLSIVYK